MEDPNLSNTNKPKSPYRINPIYFKVGFILFLVLLLSIPNGFVKSLIQERSYSKQEVQREIAASWGNAQVLSGPILAIPYTSIHREDQKPDWRVDHVYYFTPSQVDISTNVDSEIRQKSIYEAILFTADFDITGQFDIHDLPLDGEVEIHWSEAKMIIGIQDPSGINSQVHMQWNDKSCKVAPGSVNTSVVANGIHAFVNIDIQKTPSYSFDIKFKIRGHESIQFEPTAQNTSITMQSDWASPSFIGKVLADQREINDTGFTAEWNLTEFNRSIPSSWSDSKGKLGNEHFNFGVKLVQPVDYYQKNMRSAKYALMIISLTFVVFFFFEVMYKSKIHAIQYTFVGIALSIFYYLLLSISEHLGFSMAYLVAAVAVIILISTYSISVLSSRKYAGILFGILTLLYSYIYVLLQLEEFALIAGSVGLFAILAYVMYLSRNINWYQLHSKD